MIDAHLKKFDIAKIRKDFPILQQKMNGRPLVYLDNSVSSQKPACVIDLMTNFCQNDYASTHRGVYELSARSTRAFEQTREHMREFINARAVEEIIFTSGTTESINLVAQSFGRSQFKEKDEIIVSIMEHHSNIVPWQMLCNQVGTVLRVIPVTDKGELNLEAYRALFTERTKMVAITHASNVLGTINPLEEIIQTAHQHQVPVLVDGAQAFPHLAVDMQILDCDFYAFSAHKAYGPTGIGVLYGKQSLLEKMPPYQGGGNMIESVTLDNFTSNKLPYKFEAGTSNILGVIAWDAALHYLKMMGMDNIVRHEQLLLHYAQEKLSEISGLRMIGTAKNKVGVISFVLSGIHPHDIGTVLDYEGIAVRAGHHCAMPLIERLGVPATVRVSFGVYNTLDEIDALIAALKTVKRMFA
jgi:cysteine desulfurase / selenocysteine lyase